MITEPRLPYILSQDYDLLFNLVRGGLRIVCFVDYFSDRKEKKEPYRDICTARKIHDTYLLTCRGTEYGTYAKTKEYLIENCTRSNLSFIEPTDGTEL